MKGLGIVLVFLVSLTLSGCHAWPEEGQGGMAELDPMALPGPVEADQAPEAAQALRFELELVSRHLDVLVLEGAELCFPATVEQARQRQNRIARALHGGLPFDGANDLIIQRRLLGRLERQLDYVKQQEVCIPPIVAGAVGTDDPFFEGRKPHQRLLNRRVTGEFVGISGTVPVVED